VAADAGPAAEPRQHVPGQRRHGALAVGPGDRIDRRARRLAEQVDIALDARAGGARTPNERVIEADPGADHHPVDAAEVEAVGRRAEAELGLGTRGARRRTVRRLVT